MTRMRFETVCHGHFGALDPPKNWPQGATQLVKQKMTETETRQTEHKLIWCEKLLYGEAGTDSLRLNLFANCLTM